MKFNHPKYEFPEAQELLIDKLQNFEDKPPQPSKPIPKFKVLGKLLTCKFILLYVVSFLKTGVSFYYSNHVKIIGMTLIGDDRILTYAMIPGFLTNLFVRLSAGFFYKKFGFNVMYYTQISSNFLCSMILLKYGNLCTGFFAFVIMQRVSSGSLYPLK